MSVVGLVQALHTIAMEVVEEGVGRRVNWGKSIKMEKESRTSLSTIHQSYPSLVLVMAT